MGQIANEMLLELILKLRERVKEKSKHNRKKESEDNHAGRMMRPGNKRRASLSMRYQPCIHF